MLAALERAERVERQLNGLLEDLERCAQGLPEHHRPCLCPTCVLRLQLGAVVDHQRELLRG